MKGKIKAIIITVTLLAMLLIEPLYLKIAIAQQNVDGTQDDTWGVWMFNAGTTVPAGAPTDDIIERAIFYDVLDYIGDTAEEVYDFGWGPNEPAPGQEDTTKAEVIQGLSAVDDFGNIANAGDDSANFDTGKSGYFLGGFDPLTKMVIHPDGISTTGTLGPNGALTKGEAEAALSGCEIFIFEDAELSGMTVTLSNTLGLTLAFSIVDLQVNPPTTSGADDTLIAIDLDTLAGFDGSFIDTIRIQDDGITSPSTYGDTTLEIDAIAIRSQLIECPVVFYTDPSTTGNITFEGETYAYGETDMFPYGTSGLATANVPDDWIFSHWIAEGNVELSSATENPTTVTVVCGGNLTAVFTQGECTVVFYTDPPTVDSITFMGQTYAHGETATFPYGTSGLAYADAPEGWVFDHWEATANLTLSPNEYANPVEVTVKCGGNLTAVFRQLQCPVVFFTFPSSIGNITFKDVTYNDGQGETFPYGTSGSATANAPDGWVFDHWETIGNVQVSSTTDNPTTFTITCGGNLTAVFVEEHGNGDLGTIGYWKHVFYVWKTSKGSFKDFTGELLEGYLANINTASRVFSENYTLTLDSAYDLLWSKNSSMRTRALKQCLASWLNWANGAVTMSQMVDTNYNGIPDMPFGDAMATVEDILRDPNSSWSDLEYAKDICDSINNM